MSSALKLKQSVIHISYVNNSMLLVLTKERKFLICTFMFFPVFTFSGSLKRYILSHIYKLNITIII